MAKIRAVVKLPNRNPVVMLIDKTPVALAKQVGGLTKIISFGDDTIAIVNEKADRLQIEKNTRYLGKQIYGPVVFVGKIDEKIDSLNEEMAEQIRRMIKAT